MKGGIKKLGESTVVRYILRRLLALIPVLLGVTFITYGLMYISPKDPVEMMLQASGTAPSHPRARRSDELPRSVQQLTNRRKRGTIQT